MRKLILLSFFILSFGAFANDEIISELKGLEIVTSNSRNGVAKKLMEVYGIEVDEE